MSRTKYRAALKQLGLTQKKAAMLLDGASEATGARWARNGIKGAPAVLLGLLLAGKITAKDIETVR
jgi:hypothetical protein